MVRERVHDALETEVEEETSRATFRKKEKWTPSFTTTPN